MIDMFAKIPRDLSTVIEYRQDVDPIPPGQLHPLKPYWVPVVEIENNTAVTPYFIREPASVVIYADRVEKVTVIRDKTTPELDADDQRKVDRMAEIGTIDYVQFRIDFLQENRIRALEGKQPITVDQFREYVKGLIRA